jgi:hypothetical protein
MQPESNEDRDPKTDSSRRVFLQCAAGITAGLAVTAATPAGGRAAAAEGREARKSAASLPTVALGPHQITRLIIGGNPIYGHSHFNRLYSQHLIDYHTPERVVELLRTCEAAGISTWQNSYDERTLADVEKVRREWIRFHWLCLGKPDWDRYPERIEHAAQYKPLGIAPHGALAERLHRQNKIPVLLDLLKRIRATGALVGLSAHNPALIELAEEQRWEVDYYMCCQYYLTRPREEFQKILGEVPMGEVYLPSDRDRMLQVVRAARKPCLVYKVLAAGRADLSPAGVRAAFQHTLSHIKPSDAMIVGMFQEFGDQVAMNAGLVRELCGQS